MMLDWRINGRALEIQDEESSQWSRLCDAFGIARVEVNLLTGAHEIVLFVDSDRGGLNTAKVPREDIQKRSIMSRLYKLGLSLLDGDDDIPIVQQILFESEQNAPLVYYHDHLGFAECDGTEVFLLDEPIGAIDPKKAKSHYSLPEVLTPRGTLFKWRRIIENEVIGHPAMELALAIGAVAPIAHLLRKDAVITDLPIIALIGPSTTGKSSAMRVGASIWGYPLESVGIIDDLNTTENAFFEMLARNTGVPTFVDETSAQTGWDFERAIYHLPKGRGKRRCNQSGALRKPVNFSGAVIFTGEHSLIEAAEESSGLRACIVELRETWTDDAAHAERLTEKLCRCYGTAAPVLITWILSHKTGLKLLYQLVREDLAACVEHMSVIEGRVLKIFAMILLAAHVIREALDLNIDIEAMKACIARQIVGNRPEQDEVTCVYRELIEKIAANGSKFSWPNRRSDTYPQGKDVWGTFGYRGSVSCVWIGKSRFLSMLKACGIHELKDIARHMVDKGWLVDFGSRHYCRSHVINGMSIEAVCLLLPEVPNLLERLKTLPNEASSREMSLALRGDVFEATVLSSQSEADQKLRDAEQETDSLMACGFSVPYAQGEAFVINELLAKKLGIKDHIFVTVITDDHAVLLSQQRLTTGSLDLPLTSWKGTKICKNTIRVQTLMNVLNLEIEEGQAVAMTIIQVRDSEKGPVAAVAADFSDPAGVVVGSTTSWVLPTDVKERN